MRNRIDIYFNLLKAIYLNEIKNFNLFHSFTNASQFISIYSKGFSFIHINKNGGSSIEKMLQLKDQIHIPYYTLEDYFGVLEAKELKTFTIVRNPFDRVVSQYHYRYENNQFNLRNKKVSFDEFCIRAYKELDSEIINYPLMFKTQFDWLKDYKGEISHLDFIGKFENYDESVKDILDLLGYAKNDIIIPQKRKSNRERDWTKYYNKNTREIVFNYFKKDFETFGYNPRE